MSLPTKKEIDKAREYLGYDDLEAINVIFKNNKLSTIEKIYALDKIYACNLNLTEKGFRKLAEKLDKLVYNLSVKNIASLKLKELDPNYTGRRGTVGYVFASKYCYFTKPEEFIIYDKYADISVNYLIYGEAKQRYKDDYEEYCNRVKKMLVNNFNYRELDKYLWLFGQVLEAIDIEAGNKKSKKKNMKKYQSRISYIIDNKHLSLDEIKESLKPKE